MKVDGITAGLGTKVSPGQSVEAEGSLLSRSDELVLLAYHKPAGIECTTAKDNPDNIVDHIHYPQRIYPVGRLDKNSTGLILLTNTGELVNAISRSANQHEKEYIVKVDRPLTETFFEKMRKGIFLKELNVTTRECEVTPVASDCFRIVLTQGFNRQIRRMCRFLGYEVVSLHRIRIMNILLGDLKEDTYRILTGDELKTLIGMLEDQKENG